MGFVGKGFFVSVGLGFWGGGVFEFGGVLGMDLEPVDCGEIFFFFFWFGFCSRVVEIWYLIPA